MTDTPSPMPHPPERMPKTVWGIISASTIILFACSSARHLLFQSNGFDLGIFDQVAYLIGRGEVPFSTINDTHHMADHAAWSFFPVGLLYWLYPSVYWLFAIQAFSLSIAVWPLWHLARMSGLSRSQSLGIAI
ncbi:MAG: DUF2079 domain-containing protein, partial [Cyanobacteria bacterium P01_E01_bin.45]